MTDASRALRILIAPDKFKATLSAPEAAAAMQRGAQSFARNRRRSAECLLRPLADGGEGSHASLHALRPDLNEATIALPDAIGRKQSVVYLEDGVSRAVYLETALVLGLELPGTRSLSVQERTSAGVGRWIRVMLESGARELHLFLGGSGTSDGGFGLARELGLCWSSRTTERDPSARLTANREPIDSFLQVPTNPNAALQIDAPPPGLIQLLQEATFFIYSDVRNPLLGPRGAARAFAPQKGAGPEEVERLEARLANLEASWSAWSGRNCSCAPGAGAAGGLALPLLHGAHEPELQSGSRFFAGQAGLSEFLHGPQGVDLVLTGEGRADRARLEGKCISAVRDLVVERRNNYAGAPLLALLCGRIAEEDRPALAEAGFDAVRDTLQDAGTPPERARWPLAPEEAAARLARSTERLLDQLEP